jgi:hypothetical protein
MALCRNLLIFGLISLLLASVAYGCLFGERFELELTHVERLQNEGDNSGEVRRVERPSNESGNSREGNAPSRFAETPPPPDLPITPWGKRDHFPVIRNPEFLPAQKGDIALAPEESVLGIVIAGDVRAYSTNQLNKHEMVIDEIGGTPVLITY